MADSERNTITPLWTEDEVAAYLRVEVSTVRTWVKRLGLPTVKAGSLNRFRKDDIDRWTERRADGEAA